MLTLIVNVEDLPGRQNYFEAFIKAAQYLAGLTAQQDIWSETGKVLVNFFGAEVGALEERRANAEAAGHRWAFSERYASRTDLEAESREAIAEVLESGFLSTRIIFTPAPLSIACFPITRKNQVVAVMVVGHKMSGPLPRELLNVYLAVAGLVGTTVERLASERELWRHRRQLEEEITERKRAEEALRRLNMELDRRVLERTAQLETANREMHDFTYTVSHDLRAPLRHIDGFMELLQQKAGQELDEESRHYMDAISGAARKMGLLVDDLLSFSRMGRHAMSVQRVELGPLVRAVIRELESDAAGRNIAWRIGDLPVVTGDRAMLRIVLTNLIANALKFTRPREQAEIEIGCTSEKKNETVVFVRDNGVGFDMNYADKLFGVFQRLHRAEEFEGTGIGLANVRRIISRHGGKTWAEAQVNQGAAFYFSLPRSVQG